MSAPNKPPSHLSNPSRAWWSEITRDWELDPASLRVLTSAAEAWDRKEDARRLLKREGIVVHDRFGQKREHPAVKIWEHAEASFHRACRDLGLEGEPEPSGGRRRPGQRSHND